MNKAVDDLPMEMQMLMTASLWATGQVNPIIVAG
jgi:hypothetical protein